MNRDRFPALWRSTFPHDWSWKAVFEFKAVAGVQATSHGYTQLVDVLEGSKCYQG